MSDTVQLVLRNRNNQLVSVLLVNTTGKKYGHILRLLYVLDVKTYHEDANFMNFNLYYKIDGAEDEYDVVNMHDCFFEAAENEKYVNISQEYIQDDSIDYETMEEYEDVLLKNDMLLKRLDLKTHICPEYSPICFIDDSGASYKIHQPEFESYMQTIILDLSENYIEDIEGWLREFYLAF